MASLLPQLLSGKENTRCICIQDTVDHNGAALLTCLVHELSKRVDEIHLFAFDTSPNAAMADLDEKDPEIRQKIRYHDGWTDPLGWNSDSASGEGGDMVRFTSDRDLIDHIGESRRKESKTVGVVIDSLTPIIINRTAALTCRSIHSLTNQRTDSDFEICQVLSILHGDVHDESSVRTISHQCNTVISVSSNPSTVLSDREPTGYADILHKKPSGKVLRKREGYTVSSDFRLQTFTGTPKPEENIDTNAQPDPTANLTFNLTLTESEKRARENVVLPFTQASNIPKTGTGQIFYEPDKDDDYDDEDPDDDLDI